MSSHISEAHCKREQRAVMRQLTANLNSILLGHGDAPGSDHYGLCKVIPPLYLLSLSWNIGILIILLLFHALLGIIIIVQMIFLVIVDHPNS